LYGGVQQLHGSWTGRAAGEMTSDGGGDSIARLLAAAAAGADLDLLKQSQTDSKSRARADASGEWSGMHRRFVYS